MTSLKLNTGVKNKKREPTSTRENIPQKKTSLNLDKYRLDQSFQSSGVKKVITHIPVDRPKQDFFRIKNEEHFDCGLLIDERTKDGYLLDPTIYELLIKDAKLARLYFGVTMQGNPFFWARKLPSPDGKLDSWNESAHRIAEMAKNKWLRVTSNRELGAYEAHTVESSTKEPVWPDMSLEELIEIAFKDRMIDNEDHELVRYLLGEIS